jgi:hypothetical protein
MIAARPLVGPLALVRDRLDAAEGALARGNRTVARSYVREARRLAVEVLATLHQAEKEADHARRS